MRKHMQQSEVTLQQLPGRLKWRLVSSYHENVQVTQKSAPQVVGQTFDHSCMLSSRNQVLCVLRFTLLLGESEGKNKPAMLV